MTHATLAGQAKEARGLRGASTAVLLSVLLGLVTTTVALAVAQLSKTELASPVPEELDGQALVEHFSKLDEAGIADLEKYAFGLLRRNTLDGKAYQYLGIAAGLRKDLPRQEAIASAAARLTLRDPRAQLSAANIALQSRKYDEALLRLDGLLRARPELGGQFFPVLGNLVMLDDALLAVSKTLAQTPSWRRAFIESLVMQQENWPKLYKLFSGLRQAGDGPSAREMRQLIAALAKHGNHDEAYFVWLESLDQAKLARVRNVFDGGFDLDPESMLFDWTLRNGKSATSTVAMRPGSSTDRALRLDLKQHQGAFAAATQYMRLIPGNYVFSYETLVQSLEAARGLVWRVKCVEDGRLIAESAEIKAAGPWVRTTSVFTVPPEKCATQLLRLETAARQGLDTRLTGLLFVDDVSVEAVSGQTPGGEGQ